MRERFATGAVVAIVTATANRFVTGPIARAFGIPHLVAIPAPGERRLHRPARGTPAFKTGKIRHVEAWLRASACAGRAFRAAVSTATPQRPAADGQGQRPDRRRPDDALRAHASAHGLPVIAALSRRRRAQRPKDSKVCSRAADGGDVTTAGTAAASPR